MLVKDVGGSFANNNNNYNCRWCERDSIFAHKTTGVTVRNRNYSIAYVRLPGHWTADDQLWMFSRCATVLTRYSHDSLILRRTEAILYLLGVVVHLICYYQSIVTCVRRIKKTKKKQHNTYNIQPVASAAGRTTQLMVGVGQPRRSARADSAFCCHEVSAYQCRQLSACPIIPADLTYRTSTLKDILYNLKYRCPLLLPITTINHLN